VVRKCGEKIGYLDQHLANEIIWSYKAAMCSRPTKVIRIMDDPGVDQIINVIIEIHPLSTEEATAMSDSIYPLL
jgi:hypothetical protein